MNSFLVMDFALVMEIIYVMVVTFYVPVGLFAAEFSKSRMEKRGGLVSFARFWLLWAVWPLALARVLALPSETPEERALAMQRNDPDGQL